MKENNNNTILFRQREEHYVSKYKFKTNEKGKIDFKVIPYPKYKKVFKKGRKLVKPKKLSLILLIILIVCTYFAITNKRISYIKNKNTPTTISTSSNKIVSDRDFDTYSNIITSHIKNFIQLDYQYNTKTEAMHKNGSYIYAQGIISGKDKNNLYFDIILKNDKAYSLILNDMEYIK